MKRLIKFLRLKYHNCYNHYKFNRVEELDKTKNFIECHGLQGITRYYFDKLYVYKCDICGKEQYL